VANKLALPPAEYMVVLGIYAGWDRTAYTLFAGLALTLAYAIVTW